MALNGTGILLAPQPLRAAKSSSPAAGGERKRGLAREGA
jgi:hypothetical protein